MFLAMALALWPADSRPLVGLSSACLVAMGTKSDRLPPGSKGLEKPRAGRLLTKGSWTEEQVCVWRVYP